MSLPTQPVPGFSDNCSNVITLQILCLGKASSRRDPRQENHHGSSLRGVFHPSAPQGARGHGPRTGFPLSSRLRLQARAHPEEPAVAQPFLRSTAGAGSTGAPMARDTCALSPISCCCRWERPALHPGTRERARSRARGGRQQLKAQHFVKSINENI